MNKDLGNSDSESSIDETQYEDEDITEVIGVGTLSEMSDEFPALLSEDDDCEEVTESERKVVADCW